MQANPGQQKRFAVLKKGRFQQEDLIFSNQVMPDGSTVVRVSLQKPGYQMVGLGNFTLRRLPDSTVELSSFTPLASLDTSKQRLRAVSRAGIGRLALKQAETIAKGMGAKTISLDPLRGTRGFYAKAGFTPALGGASWKKRLR
ncbi:GNAT family N-acetyltransferase [Candidatus Micrarchaeota archaeon]|nr:GNAT family N-acetyltransferase [Candidatus Micrarchaeota archaeon]